jgi:glutamyl-tRNA reductase
MGRRILLQWCPVKEKMVPVDQVQRRVHANAAHGYIPDEMAPTRNPLNPKEIYTSKSKLRAAYKAAGAVEVGDAYDRGYSPEKESSRSVERLTANVMNQIRQRLG